MVGDGASATRLSVYAPSALLLRFCETLNRESQPKTGELRESVRGKLIGKLSISKKLNNDARRSACRSELRKKLSMGFEPFNEFDHPRGIVLLCNNVSNAVSPSRVRIVSRKNPSLRRLSPIPEAMRKVGLQSQGPADVDRINGWMDNEQLDIEAPLCTTHAVMPRHDLSIALSATSSAPLM
jgi:hypothetical protein